MILATEKGGFPPRVVEPIVIQWEHNQPSAKQNKESGP